MRQWSSAALRVQPARLSLLHRAAVRTFCAGSSEARPAAQAAAGPPAGSAAAAAAVPPPPAAPSAAAEAPHVYRKGARAVFEMPSIKDTIELTEEEAALFRELLDATKQAGAGCCGGCRGVGGQAGATCCCWPSMWLTR